jgi:hypothetical protein
VRSWNSLLGFVKLEASAGQFSFMKWASLGVRR